MIAEAARVDLRRLIRARQRSSAMDAPTRAIALRMPPTIAAIFLAVLLWAFNLDEKNCACEDDKPGTVVCDEVGAGSEVMVAGSLGLISTWSVKVKVSVRAWHVRRTCLLSCEGICDGHSLPCWCDKIGSQIPSFYCSGRLPTRQFPTCEMGAEKEMQLTVTSMKAHSGTRVPLGTVFEYLSHPSDGEQSRRRNENERLWRVDGRAVERPRFPPTNR